MCDHHNLRKGATLDDQQEHQKDHKAWSRRSFLTTLGITGGVSLTLGGVPVGGNMLSPLQNMLLSCQSDRSLVMIRLKGGNDGLNTIIPLPAYDYYRNVRPTLGFKENELTNLTNEVAIPNFMAEHLSPMWGKGDVAVVNSVGYQEQNLSHFRSADIWASSSNPDEIIDTGWLGRYFSSTNPDYLAAPPEVPLAIQIGGFGNLMFNGAFDQGRTNLAMSVTDPDQLYQIAQTGQLFDAVNKPDDCYYGDQVGYMRSVANNVFTYAGKIKDAYDLSEGQGSTDYLDDDLGNQLAIVARLLKGNLGTKIYMVSIDGFDTHAEQKDDHQRLMTSVAQNVKVFYEDLAAAQLDKAVLSMTFSEFGRRIEENGSLGTDHGASAPVMFFGGELGSNHITGNLPNLQDPDVYGNLKNEYDFRQLYATVLENWLGVDAVLVDEVIGEQFARVEDLIYKCGVNTSTQDIAANRVDHHVRYSNDGHIEIVYALKGASKVKVDLFDIAGRFVTTLSTGNQAEGQHFVQLEGISRNLPAAQYVYRIQTTEYGNASGKVNRLF